MRIRCVLVAVAVLLTACGGTPEREFGGPGDGTGEVTVWFHEGSGPERVALEDQVSRFNALGTGVTVRTVRLPVGDYGRQLEAAQRADRLPDLFDTDGTALAGFVREQSVVALDDLLDPAAVGDLVPGVAQRGLVAGRRYGIGSTDGAVVLFGNRKLLADAGVRLPAGPDDAWTAAEFGTALDRLAAADPDGKVLDLRRTDGTVPGTAQVTGWWATAFAPVVRSAGGDLLNADGTAAAGTLDAPGVPAALAQLAGWAGKVQDDPRDTAFRSGQVALSWASTRAWPAYARALGRNLAVLPLPDFGAGTKTTQGGWAWAVSTRSAEQRAAATFVDFLLRPAEVALTARASGAAPGNRAALAADRAYRPDGAMAVPAALLARSCGTGPVSRACTAVPLPVTAGWNTVRTEFGDAVRSVLGGTDPAAALTTAATAIDRDFADHGGYRVG